MCFVIALGCSLLSEVAAWPLEVQVRFVPWLRGPAGAASSPGLRCAQPGRPQVQLIAPLVNCLVG